MKHIFAYGTLMFPEILNVVTGKVFSMQPAHITDYKRVSIQNADGSVLPYPALVRSEGCMTEGFLIKDVDTKSFDSICTYEDMSMYVLEDVTVETENGLHEATVFVWKEGRSEKLQNGWDAQSFRDVYLKKYLESLIV